ncbi:DNA-binding transcriptional LysR family regulator [Pseudomonas sp. JUb42]|uniref:LysR family transcriptional regulator n=1 Tax=Pseudomonas sp. JUb42 TaxID=2940611 RepID=UPI0021681329|nr:LysR family transcriptional regulator [Pseudomonas sp. JUb42]MCS3469960.1 DNA-binding transcriptional LysR family regulator [Pseudomonas sp. JUb42]
MTAILYIDLLRTFHAVVRYGKFNAAAEHLHRSPAAVSVHIQRLEGVAGGRLLNRDNQSSSLTELGRRLLTSTATLLRTHDQALADLHGTNVAGRITLGVPEEYVTHVIRETLPSFTCAWPNVVVELKTGPSPTLREWVQRGTLQAAVIAQPKGDIGPDTKVLMSTTPVWVGPVSTSVALDDPLPLAVHAVQCCYREAMTESLRMTGRRSRIVLESHSSQAVKACVEAGLAVSLIDRGKVTRHMQILEGMPVIPDYDIVLVRSAASSGNEAVELLARAMQSTFRL